MTGPIIAAHDHQATSLVDPACTVCGYGPTATQHPQPGTDQLAAALEHALARGRRTGDGLRIARQQRAQLAELRGQGPDTDRVLALADVALARVEHALDGSTGALTVRTTITGAPLVAVPA